MNYFELIVNLVESIAWPAAAIVIALILKAPLRELVPLVQKMKYKNFEMEFGRKLAQVQSEANNTSPLSSLDVDIDQNHIFDLAQISPRAAITESWRLVEQTLLETAKKLFGEDFKFKTATFKVFRNIERHEKIDDGAVEILRELRALRNEAIHSPEFALSFESALSYSRTAGQIISYLKTIKP